MTIQSGRTRIKFCGMTRAGDVRLASELGVDAVGFVFAPRSARRLDLQQALALRQAAAPLVSVVALMMDNPAAEVAGIVRQLRPQWLQFHGEESDSFCRQFGLPFIKTIAVRGQESRVIDRASGYPSASAFLLDGHAPGEPGGQGQRFDWHATADAMAHLERPVLLAGGLTPGNVREAIAALRPFGVDVSSGIERAPGVKDGARMQEFVEEVSRG